MSVVAESRLKTSTLIFKKTTANFLIGENLSQRADYKWKITLKFLAGSKTS